MKRFLLLSLVAVATLFCSCQNEDISVKQDTTFRINLFTIIEPFTYELYQGELNYVWDGYELRTRLFIYNNNGVLVTSSVDYGDNYGASIIKSLPLDEGEYTAVVVSDWVQRNGNEIAEQFWHLNNESKLHQMTITDPGTYAPNRFAMLGVQSKNFIVDNYSTEVENIDVEPAGALILCWVRNYNTYPDVKRVAFTSKKVGTGVLFDNNGSISYTVKEADGGKTCILGTFEPNPKYEGGYGYYYMLPNNDNYFSFLIELDNGDAYGDDSEIFDIKKGDEWYCEMNFDDEETGEITYTYELVNASRSGVVSKSIMSIPGEYNTMSSQKVQKGEYRVLDLI